MRKSEKERRERRESLTDDGRRERDVRRFRHVHIVRGIRLADKLDVCASLVMYRAVLSTLSSLSLYLAMVYRASDGS